MKNSISLSETCYKYMLLPCDCCSGTAFNWLELTAAHAEVEQYVHDRDGAVVASGIVPPVPP
jgi:hypothetical protein